MGLFGGGKKKEKVREGYWVSISYKDLVEYNADGDDYMKAYAGNLKEPFGTKSGEWCHPTKVKSRNKLPFYTFLVLDVRVFFEHNNEKYIFGTYEYSVYDDHVGDGDKFISGGPLKKGETAFFRFEEVMKDNGVDVSHFEAELIVDEEAQMALAKHAEKLLQQ